MATPIPSDIILFAARPALAAVSKPIRSIVLEIFLPRIMPGINSKKPVGIGRSRSSHGKGKVKPKRLTTKSIGDN